MTPPTPSNPQHLPALLAVAILGILACDKDTDDPIYEVPDGATAGRYEPDGGLTTFPDDLHTVDDSHTLTGLQVLFQPAARDGLAASLPDGFNLLEALEELDGFGTTAGIVLRFSGPLDPATVDGQSARLIQLEGEGAPLEIPAEFEWFEEDASLILVPLYPLVPATLHAAVVTTDVLDAAGDPIWAAPALRSLLDGTAQEEPLTRLHGRYEELLAATEDWATVERIAAATVFTTQSVFDEDLTVAQALQGLTPELTSQGGCQPEGGVIRCEAILTAADFLGDDEHLALTPGETPIPQRDYDVPVSFYLPDDGTTGPWPTIIYGHGLGGSRDEGRGFASRLSGLGVAVAAIDAPTHNDHPTNLDYYELLWIFEFFGLGLEGTFDVLRLRDHWRQATWDKLQLAAAIRSEPDLDGDGNPDLESGRVYFSGHSLGGTMGPQLMALDGDVAGGDLSVPGARVSEIVHRGEIFAPVISMFAPEGTSQDDVDGFFPLLQAAIERGEPANYATLVLDGNRDLLMTMVLDDGIIPNACNRSMARALGVQHAPPLLQTVDGLDLLGALPASANLAGRTAVLYQYDEELDDDQLVPAVHEHAHSNELALAQLRHWWQTVLDGGPAEVIDPYNELGL